MKTNECIAGFNAKCAHKLLKLSLHKRQVARQAGAYPSFRSSKWIGVLWCRESERTTYVSPLHLFCCGLGRQHTRAPLAAAISPFMSPPNPSRPMMNDDINDDDRPQHRELCPPPPLAGCALETPGCHRRLTFAFGRPEKLTFLYINLNCWHSEFPG